MHTITRSIVRGATSGVFLRAECSCGQFDDTALRLSAPQRRRQDRLVREHLATVEDPAVASAMVIAAAIEAPL